MTRYALPLTAACALLLSACGGGGGSAGSGSGSGASLSGSTPATPAVQGSQLTAITPANAPNAAGNGYAGAALVTQSSSSVAGLVAGVTIAPAGVNAVNPVLGLVKRAYAQGTLVTGVTMSQTCTGGGTVRIDANTRNDQTLSNGDTVTATMTNCVEDGAVLNGGLSIAVSGVSGDIFNTGKGAVTLATRFNSFNVAASLDSGTATLTGDMTITASAVTDSNLSLAISGTSLQANEQRTGSAAVTRTLANYSVTGTMQGSIVSTAASFTLSGNSAALGQFSYTVKNLKPFVTSNGATPTSGALVVNGAASSVTVTAIDGATVRLDYSAKGDGVVTDSKTLAWRDLLAAN